AGLAAVETGRHHHLGRLRLGNGAVACGRAAEGRDPRFSRAAWRSTHRARARLSGDRATKAARARWSGIHRGVQVRADAEKTPALPDGPAVGAATPRALTIRAPKSSR